MISPTGKLRESVQSAAETVREAAKDTGKLVITALVISSGALLLALAALLAVMRIRKAAA